MDIDQINRLAQLAGENRQSRPTFYVPVIKFNGKTGEFQKVEFGESKETKITPLPKELSFVILKKRQALGAFPNYFSNQFTSPSEKIALFKKQNGKFSLAETATPKELREKYPILKTKNIAYILYEGSVCQLDIKGLSLSSYWDYQKSLRDENLHSFQVITSVHSEKVENDNGVFYKMVFSTSEKQPNLAEVEKHLTVVAQKLAAIDSYNASFNLKNEEIEKVPEDVEPSVQIYEEVKEEDINF